jgi:hypothetical protein
MVRLRTMHGICLLVPSPSLLRLCSLGALPQMASASGLPLAA